MTMETAAPSLSRDASLSIFSQTMGLVAITCLFTALGAYLGQGVQGMATLIPWIGVIACVIGLNAANRKEAYQLALTLLFAMGLLAGVAIGYTLHYMSVTDSSAIYQAAAATGLFVAALGAGGYAIRRDLSYLYRFAFFALLGLIVFGIVLIFARIPGGQMIYSIFGLLVFGLYSVLDFNRLRRAGQDQVIPLAAGIFLTVLNVFMLFLRIFGSSR